MTIRASNDVRVEIYRSFIEDARAPMPAEIADRLDIGIDDVAAGLRELADQEVIALVPGTDLIWLAHPFCALDAPFRVTTSRQSWDAICVWDAFGILTLLESDGQVATRCPECGEGLSAAVVNGTAEAPSEYVVHYGVPAARWYEDIGHT